MTLRIFLGLTILFIGAYGATTEGPPYVVRTDKLYHRFELFSPAEPFTFDNVRLRARKDLRRIGNKDLKLIRISYFSDPKDLERTAAGKGVADVTFEYWKHMYDRYGRSSPPMADVIQIGGAAVLRYSSGQEIRIEPIPMGSGNGPDRDPLMVETHRTRYQLLELIPNEDGSVECYAKFLSGGLGKLEMDKSHAVLLSLHLAKDVLGIKEVTVHLRKDPWFILDSNFPIAFRFDPAPPPTKEEFRNSAEFVVSSVDAEPIYNERRRNREHK